MTNNIRFTTGSFHFIERPQFFSIGFQLCLYLSPGKTFISVHVFLKTGFQCSESLSTLLSCQPLFIAITVVRTFILPLLIRCVKDRREPNPGQPLATLKQSTTEKLWRSLP